MTGTITLSEDDNLVHYLYKASGVSLNNKLINTRLCYGAILMLIGLDFFALESSGNGYIFLALGLLFLFLYPTLEKRRIKKAYRKLIETQIAYASKPLHYNFGTEVLQLRNDVVETKIKSSEVKKIVELKDHYLLQLPSTQSMLIPKSQIDIQQFLIFIEQMKEVHGVELLDHTKWKWAPVFF